MESQEGYVEGYSIPYSGTCDGLLVPRGIPGHDKFPMLNDEQHTSVAVHQDIDHIAIAHTVLKLCQTKLDNHPKDSHEDP